MVQKAAGRSKRRERQSSGKKRMIDDGWGELLLDPEVTRVRELQLAGSFRRAADPTINISWVVWVWRVEIKPQLFGL